MVFHSHVSIKTNADMSRRQTLECYDLRPYKVKLFELSMSFTSLTSILNGVQLLWYLKEEERKKKIIF